MIPTRFQHWDKLFAFEYQLFAFNSKKIRTCGGLFTAKKISAARPHFSYTDFNRGPKISASGGRPRLRLGDYKTPKKSAPAAGFLTPNFFRCAALL
jgi:hypothetical protein